MAQILWKPLYSVEVKEIDTEHKQLISFMHEIYSRLEKTIHLGDYSDFFEKLRQHAEKHFGTEERYFAEFAYPGAKRHIKEHDAIKKKISALEDAFNKNPSPTVIFETLRFLDDWLFDHVVLYDKKYTGHFKAHGLS